MGMGIQDAWQSLHTMIIGTEETPHTCIIQDHKNI